MVVNLPCYLVRQWAREGRVVRPRWNFHRHHRRRHPPDHLSIAEEKIVATIDRLIICTFTVSSCSTCPSSRQVCERISGRSNFTYQGRDGLVVAGRVDTGSSDKILAILNTKFQQLNAPSCPWVNFPGKPKGRWGLGITARMSLGSAALSGCAIHRRKPHAFGAVTNDRS